MADFREEADVLLGGLIAAFNALHDQVCTSETLDGYHRDITSLVSGDPAKPVITPITVSAADASDLVTTVVLANMVRGVLKTHLLDGSAHLKQDLVNDGYLDGYSAFIDGYSAAQTPAFGQAELVLACNVLNVCKKAFNDHRTQSDVHITNDSVNNVSATNATDLASAQTLATQLKTMLNRHLPSGPTGLPRVNIVPA